MDGCISAGILGALLRGSAVLKRGTEKRPFRQKTGLLELRVEIGSGGGVENEVAQQIVSTSAAPSAATGERVITETVEHAIAVGAHPVNSRKGYAEPTPEHGSVQNWLVVKLSRFGRSGV